MVNIPIALAAVALLLLLVIGGSTQAAAVSDADDAVGTQLSGADSAAQARAAAFEARSQEALTLINRGNGAANEANWLRGDDVVNQELESGRGSFRTLAESAASDYRDYRRAHEEIRALDDGGDWDTAVAASLGVDGALRSGINAVDSFNAFDLTVGQIATQEGDNASSLLAEAGSGLNSLRNTVFVAGLVIAVLAALGIGQRLKEYR